MPRQILASISRTFDTKWHFAVLALLLCTPGARGQALEMGIKVGVPATDYFDTGSTASVRGNAVYSTGTRRYTFGLSGELRLNKSLGVEVDALYHRMGYQGAINTIDGSGNYTRTTINVAGNSLDFPLMAKYRFGYGIHPYVVGGGVIRWITSARETGAVVSGSLAGGTPSSFTLGTNNISDLRKQVFPGVTLGGGVEVGVRTLRLLPEFRYTRWTSNISSSGGLLRFTPNQAEFIIGVLF